MAYGIRGLGKLHRIQGSKPKRLKCAPRLTATRKVNQTYARKMEGHGLLCAKCFPDARIR